MLPVLSQCTHHARRAVSLLAGFVLAAGMMIGVLAGPAHAASNVSYNGGAVMTGHEKVYLVFAGSQWGNSSYNAKGDTVLSHDPVGAAPVLQEFFKGLGTGGETWSSVMTQYCQGTTVGTTQPCGALAQQAGETVGYPSGGALAGVWVDNTAPATGNASAEAVAAATHFGNTTSASNANAVYLVQWPTGSNVGGPWHNSTGSSDGPIAYANLPYISDGYTQSDSWAVVTGPVGLFTEQASHEYAETITDPFGGGWYMSGNPTQGEVGDPCEHYAAQSFGLQLITGLFWVQSEWSNAAGGCAGQTSGSGIINGTFSNGSYAWATTGPANIVTDPQTNEKGLQLGSYTVAGTVLPTSGDAQAEQNFTVPAGDHWLSFYFKQNCTDSHGSVDATLNDETNLAAQSGSVFNGYTCIANGGWMLVTAPVTPGHLYSLLLHNRNDDSNAGNTAFEDLQLSATQPTPTAPGGIQLWNECNRAWQIYWNPVPGATSYNIYANGVRIATGVTAGYYGYAYTFTSPLNEWYTVTAVNGSGTESQPSTTVINPIFDDTAC